MRKTVLLMLLVLLLVPVFSLPVYAEGISVSSESGDVVALFDNINVDKTVDGNVIAVLGNIEVDNDVKGQVVAVFGNVTVNSDVSGQVVTVFGNTRVTGNAVVHGNLITLGSVMKESGARILGQEVRIFGEYMNIDISAIMYLRLALMILYTLAALVIGLLVLAINRKKFEEMTRRIEYNTGKKLVLGLLTYAGASILMVLLLLTLLAPVLYIVLLILAVLPAGIYFGRLILRAFSPNNNIYIEFITGLITITLIKILLLYLVPQEGILLSLGLLTAFGIFVNSIGLGVLMEARFTKK